MTLAHVAHSIIWRRLDQPGRDACSLRQTPRGWNLVGRAEFVLEAQPASIRYKLSCDPHFHTFSASLRGSIGPRAVALDVEKSAGHWYLNGALVQGLEACMDLDLGFTPATNLLPIRRLVPMHGERVSAPAAWLDVSRASLQILPQWYERCAETKYWYEAPSVDYAALLEVNAAGFVVDYPGLWRADRQLVTREARDALDLELLVGLVESYAPAAEELEQSRAQLLREFAESGENRVFLLVFEADQLVAAVQLVLNRADNDPELANGTTIAHVHHLRVRRDQQRQNLGRELMRQVENEASERGFRWLTLGVDDWNTGARAFYEALGYVRFKQIAGPNHADTAYYLRKFLAPQDMPALRVRSLEAGEVDLLRQLRIEALRDSPDQLGEALADAEARSDAGWAEQVASVTAPSVHAAYIAELDGSAIGMVYALADHADSTIGRLGGMWVRPSARGVGVGAALVEAVVERSRASSKRCIQLGVVPGGSAERLYRRAGFELTGASKPFPGAESRRVLEMQLDLAPDLHSSPSTEP